MALAAGTDLLEVIDWHATECLNASSQHSLDNALKQGQRESENLYLESDADDQLIIHVIFNAATKLRSIVVSAADDGHAPKKVKLFTNRPTIGFSEAEDEKAVQEFDLSPAQVAGQPLALKTPLFQGVNCLSIFVASNQGDEETTRIGKIVVSGTTVAGMDVNAIKKADEEG